MTFKLDELAVAFATAAPFLEEGRERLLKSLDAGLRHVGQEIATQRPRWRVSSSSSPSCLSFCPPSFTHPICQVTWAWDDSTGASFVVDADQRGADWLAHQVDGDVKAITAALNAGLASVRQGWSVLGAHSEGSMRAALEAVMAETEKAIQLVVDHDERLTEMVRRRPLRAVFCGRDPWGATHWADVRYGLASGSWQKGRYLDLVFAGPDELPDLKADEVDLVVFEAPPTPPSWARPGADGTLAAWSEAGVPLVVVGDWLDGDAWNEPGLLLDLMPVRVLGSDHKSGKWDGRIGFDQLRVVNTDPLDLSFLVGTKARVEGAVRCEPRDGTTVLVEVDRGDLRHPFVAIRQQDAQSCFWLAAGTGGWGRRWMLSGEPWRAFWEAVVGWAGE